MTLYIHQDYISGTCNLATEDRNLGIHLLDNKRKTRCARKSSENYKVYTAIKLRVKIGIINTKKKFCMKMFSIFHP